VADRVDAAVKLVKVAALQAMGGEVPAEPSLDQLRQGNDPVLSLR
jgi:hypothetical protein